ncbi:MAG: DUF3306 domain-containing protein, partial [Quisquiliibacterium sp.]
MVDDPRRFLARWSRRKAEHRDGQAAKAEPQETPTAKPTATGAVVQESIPDPSATGRALDESDVAESAPPSAESAEQLPKIDELTPESDFRPFMRDEVDPSTRNAALQRLFADPHFNRICDMDIDIEDFTKFDPIPQAMLRMMEQARSLGFFADEENPEKPTQALADGDRTPPGSTSESSAQAAIADRQQADSQQHA